VQRKIAVLTAGGDCPGLNAALRAVIRRAQQRGFHTLGLRGGFAGLAQLDVVNLDPAQASGLLPRGGSILGCSGADPFLEAEGEARCIENAARLEAAGLIIIGGDHSMQVAEKAWRAGVPVVGVPKTIDNDVRGTEQTFGFDTAVAIATDAIDRLHTTAESHDRVMVLEVMGRRSGWIATFAGLAGGADAILIPEQPFDLSDLRRMIRRRRDLGKYFSIMVVGEGARFQGEEAPVLGIKSDGSPRLGGIGALLARRLEDSTGIETRVTVLGHVQRGGSPVASDRILASRYGVHAVDLIESGRFGRMTAWQRGRMTDVPLAEAAGGARLVDPEILGIASVFFG
jgi:6-phosphofructokinase 1